MFYNILGFCSFICGIFTYAYFNPHKTLHFIAKLKRKLFNNSIKYVEHKDSIPNNIIVNINNTLYNYISEEDLINTLQNNDIVTISYNISENSYIMKFAVVEKSEITTLFYTDQDLNTSLKHEFINSKYKLYSDYAGPKKNFFSDINGIIVTPNILGFDIIELETDFSIYIFKNNDKIIIKL